MTRSSKNDHLTLLLIGDGERRDRIKKGLTGIEIALAGEIFQPEALRHVPQLAPDVVLLDFAAREINTLVALQWLHKLPASPAIVAVGVTGSLTEKRLALELGADEYATLEKPESIGGALRSLVSRRNNGRGSWTAHAA